MSSFLRLLLMSSISIWYIISTSSPITASFFDTRIASSSIQQKTLAVLRLKTVSLKNQEEKDRYIAAKQFVAAIKIDTLARYKAGKITPYELQDISIELTNIVFSLDTYFANMQRYERTTNTLYYAQASENLDASRTSYERLSNITQKVSRQSLYE